jgi:hypothetical protein
VDENAITDRQCPNTIGLHQLGNGLARNAPQASGFRLTNPITGN